MTSRGEICIFYDDGKIYNYLICQITQSGNEFSPNKNYGAFVTFIGIYCILLQFKKQQNTRKKN